jgi:hypothetical protein
MEYVNNHFIIASWAYSLHMQDHKQHRDDKSQINLT